MRNRCYESFVSVDHLSEPVSYEEFFLNYLLPNKLCVLGKWVTEEWRSRRDWVAADLTPNMHFLKEHFGSAIGPIANCDLKEHDSHPKSDMPLREFLEYMQSYKANGYSEDEACLYLKDWHFTRLFPEYNAFTCPEFFSSDWLNEFWDGRPETTDDYRFVYIGPKGSWTSFHTDVYKSHSWSANICGCKKWIFLPPGEEEKLKDRFGQLPMDLRQVDLSECRIHEVLQEEGEVVFVPSGWHHQVFNMADTISINHNWLNGCNVDLCWDHIQNCLRDVQKELMDIRHVVDWHQQCQILLKATSGIDYLEFFKLICCIVNNRCLPMKNVQDDSCLDHSRFDLNQALNIVQSMKCNSDFKKLNLDKLSTCPDDLEDMIKANLDL
ncbi:hypothetical protein CAPTEDRAFT_158070 [Capitella teleta]|uniref:2-oxoglutarate and iron-dependent oxygenase JMJD4 n=1 Tax=Capitella teleta TaxID=283909 RepID=R7UA53_CAPTE|nr:hypothetical protein CAPTEDRAFT_158070 [Capitella teleta]|eukprot:ELU02976.1 hypothetical protein CAPTEDRAFT_158070 [Capitella teleta]